MLLVPNFHFSGGCKFHNFCAQNSRCLFPTFLCCYSYAIKLTVRCLSLSTVVWCKPVLDRKVDRNADKHQHTITNFGEQEPALQATGRTATNSHGQSMPYPPSAPTLYQQT